MSEVIQRKIKQMHAALEGLSTNDLSQIEVQVGGDEFHRYMKVDFNQNSDPVELANAASLLIANIASIKDHLKIWCKGNQTAFRGDALIDSNRSVALIHDLWNIDKHAELNRAPRSGILPSLKNLHTAMRLSSGTAAGSAVFMSFDPRTGQMSTGASGGGSVDLVLTGQVVDPNGVILGDFLQICTEAVDSWMDELALAGVPVP